jgi:hypothetical protein
MSSHPRRGLNVSLYPKHFTIGENEMLHQYQGPLQCFVDAINQLKLNTKLINHLHPSYFHEGCLTIFLRDYRFQIIPKSTISITPPSSVGDITNPEKGTPTIHKIKLHLTNDAITQDVQNYLKNEGYVWSPELSLEFEALALVHLKLMIALSR